MAAGGYAVRCAEYPHMVISVVVVGTPYFAAVDDKGTFKLPDADSGKATLKVWSNGRWVHQEGIELGAKSGNLRIKVGGQAARASGE